MSEMGFKDVTCVTEDFYMICFEDVSCAELKSKLCFE